MGEKPVISQLRNRTNKDAALTSAQPEIMLEFGAVKQHQIQASFSARLAQQGVRGI